MESTRNTNMVLPYNEKVTKQMQNDAKFKAYKEWAVKNGTILDKVNILI